MDCPTTTVDNQIAACPEAGKPLVNEVHGGSRGQPAAASGGLDKQQMAADTAAAVKAGTLPQLAIDHPPAAIVSAGPPAGAAEHHWYTGALNVAEDIGSGAAHEIVDHPGRVALSFAIGAGTAAIASVVAAPVAIAATVGGIGYGAYQIYKHAPGWVEAAKELNHPELYNQTQLAKAHLTWQNFGGGATDIAAGIAGGVAYRAASTAIAEELEDAGEVHPVKTAAAASTTNNDGGASSQVAAPPGDGGSSAHGVVIHGHEGSIAHQAIVVSQGQNGQAGGEAAIAPADENVTVGTVTPEAPPAAPATAEITEGVPAAVEAPSTGPATAEVPPATPAATDAPPAPPPASDVPTATPAATDAPPAATAATDTPPATPALTEKEIALANSIKQNQGIFAAANQDSDNGVVESTKQLYNVRLDKVTEDAGRRIFTLENRTDGVLVPKGAYVATRLDAAGNPIVEDGMVNNWSLKASQVPKTYQVDPETLANSDSFVAPTRTDGPSVHMVPLDKPIEITTAWGTMKGKIGDWLANYDYDAANGTAGKDYAIVSGQSYKQTYQPKLRI